jgi:hypothetical protein
MSFESIAASVKVVAVFLSTIVLAYGGLVVMTNPDPRTRNEWKEIAAGVFIGLAIIFLAPIISSLLSGGSYCR